MNNQLLLKKNGFNINRKESGICKLLAMFVKHFSASDIVVTIELKEFLLESLSKKKIKKIYAICDEHKMNRYKNLGWKPIDSKIYPNGIDYLILKVI